MLTRTSASKLFRDAGLNKAGLFARASQGKLSAKVVRGVRASKLASLVKNP